MPGRSARLATAIRGDHFAIAFEDDAFFLLALSQNRIWLDSSKTLSTRSADNLLRLIHFVYSSTNAFTASTATGSPGRSGVSSATKCSSYGPATTSFLVPVRLICNAQVGCSCIACGCQAGTADSLRPDLIYRCQNGAQRGSSSYGLVGQ